MYYLNIKQLVLPVTYLIQYDIKGGISVPDLTESFKKLNKENLSDQIISQIKELIAQGIFKPGDMLPSERELATKLGVSRLPLREALKTLQFINVIEAKPGSGYMIKDLKVANLLDVLDEACEPGQDILNDLKEMRITIEVKAVELACCRKTARDLEKMREAIEEMEIAIEDEPEKVIEGSIKFHNAVLKASHNKLFVAILAYFSDVLNEGRKRSLMIKNRYKIAIEEHKRIYQAIEAGDVGTATNLMKIHLETSYRVD
jgi:GntR family transcriptional repressor for pyruvate dehydrogenase complex